MSRYGLRIVGVAIALIYGCSQPVRSTVSPFRVPADHSPLTLDTVEDARSTAFRVDWPPVDPSRVRDDRSPPLLSGELVANTGRLSDESAVSLRIELTRASADDDRLRWNRDLKFPEYDWMSRVRTWDRNEKWLWPNLPYLLRANGIEREQRYGGVDPGKGVDNDFAAIVVKSSGASLDIAELVTAEWHPPQGDFVDKRSVVHRAISDDLVWSIPDSSDNGTLNIWLIYADFLDYSPPSAWPSEPEFDGGILSYFSLEWRRLDDGRIEIFQCENTSPHASTGVEWEEWTAKHQHGG